jgi:DNA processing protein
MDWNSKDTVEVIYRLLAVKGLGTVQTNRMLFSVQNKVRSADELEMNIRMLLSEEQRREFDICYALSKHTPDVDYLTVPAPQYPQVLITFLRQNSPTVLSCIGNLGLLEKLKVGFCGSRNASEKGLWIAGDCARQLVEQDICIMSGYAKGVDMAAHKAALKNGGSTIIVLPEGIDAFHVKEEIRDEWDWNRVLVISEFMPHDNWMASRAMQRNNTIIALSDAVFVVEAGDTGGSLDAGLKTINMGKSLFVPFYAQLPDSAKGNPILVAKGAQTMGKQRHTSRVNIKGLVGSLGKQREPELAF